MRRPYFSDAQSRRVAVADALITIAALAAALTVRARFAEYLVTALDVAVLAPFIVLLRLAFLTGFEHYAVRPSMWLAKDVLGLVFHNLVPSAVFTALRFLSPVDFLRLPLSVILMEYVFASYAMFVLRALLAARGIRPSHDGARYRRRVLVWGEVRELADSGVLRELRARNDLVVIGILTANPLFWDTQVEGLRVLGDQDRLSEILVSNDTISGILLSNADHFPEFLAKAIREKAECHGVEVLVDLDGTLATIDT